ncbi:MAG: alpha/beta fold hydrolase [Methylomonas sp.]
MDFKNFELEFDKDGNLFQPDGLAEAIDALKEGGFTDVLVFSHGWNNDMAEANKLYEDFFGNVAEIQNSGQIKELNNRKLAVIKLFWPSKKFADEELIPGGGAASVDESEIDENILKQLDDLKTDTARLGQEVENPVSSALVEQAKALLPKLESDENARAQFVLLLRSMLNPNEAHPDDGSVEFFTEDPQKLLEALSEPVLLPTEMTNAGGAASVVEGEAAGFAGDILGGINNGVRRLLNFTTYYKMKERAGTVGRVGLAPVLRQIRRKLPGIRIHLIGHSFGGRLVTAAAHALADDASIQTLTLLQAAYSHNGLASKFDGKHDGAFRSLLERAPRPVSGPICITYTHNDKAVGIAYPLASRIAHDQAAALGDANDPYGGMGRNGAQHTKEAITDIVLTKTGAVKDGKPLTFENGKVHNIESSDYIADHGDVANHSVAYLTLTAVAAS